MTEQALAQGSELPDLDINGIMRAIPHRFPFLLVDRVVEMQAFQRAVGIKSVTMNEWFFQGHFPADPIMPGVLLIESMAQTAAVLVVSGMTPANQGHPVYFMSIDSARFRRPVRPGDYLRVEVTALRHKLGVWKFAGRVTSADTLAAEAEFSARIASR